MKYLNIKKLIPALAVIAILFSSCDKPDEVDPIGDRGQTLVKILNGGSPFAVFKNPVDFVATPTKVLAIEIRRDVANNADLNKTMTVVIKDDTAAVRLANPNYIILPSNFYTIQSEAPKVGGSGGTFTFTFQPGEFSKTIYITIPDATVLDPSSLYGLGFSVVSATAGGVVSVSKTAVVEIGAKNQFDGLYSLDFKNYHPTSNPGYTGAVTEVHFVTTGPNTVKIFWPTAGAFANPSILGGSLNYFGSQEPEYTINTTTNVVTVQNSASGAVTFYTMNPSFNSYYDPATKMLYAKFGYNYVGGTFSAASSREWTQVFTYIRPR